MIILRKQYSDNSNTALGIGASAAGGLGYYGLKHRQINKQRNLKAEGVTKLATEIYNRNNSNSLKRAWSKVSGRNKRLEKRVMKSVGEINEAAKRAKGRAAWAGAGIATAGTAVTLGIRAYKNHKKK